MSNTTKQTKNTKNTNATTTNTNTTTTSATTASSKKVPACGCSYVKSKTGKMCGKDLKKGRPMCSKHTKKQAKKDRKRSSDSDESSEQEKSESENTTTSDVETSSDQEDTTAKSSGICAYIAKDKSQCKTKPKNGATFCGKHAPKGSTKKDTKSAAEESVDDSEDPELASRVKEEAKKLFWATDKQSDKQSEPPQTEPPKEDDEPSVTCSHIGRDKSQCATKPKNGAKFCAKHTKKPKDATSSKKDLASGDDSDSSSSKVNCCAHITKKKTQCTTKPKNGAKFCAKHAKKDTPSLPAAVTTESSSTSKKSTKKPRKSRKIDDETISSLILAFKETLVLKDSDSADLFDDEFTALCQSKISQILNPTSKNSTISGYQLFMLETRNSDEFIEEHKDTAPTEVTKELAQQWNELTVDEKAECKQRVAGYLLFSSEFEDEDGSVKKPDEVKRRIAQKWAKLPKDEKDSYTERSSTPPEEEAEESSE